MRLTGAKDDYLLQPRRFSVAAAEELGKRLGRCEPGGRLHRLADGCDERAGGAGQGGRRGEEFRKNSKVDLVKFTKAINTYELVKPGDKIAVCISGGKDSMLMAKCFQELKLHNKFDFEVKFVVMDPGYSPNQVIKIMQRASYSDHGF